MSQTPPKKRLPKQIKPLTHKQRKFVEGITQGKPPTQAALSSYDTDSYGTAAVIAHENLNKPNIQDALRPFLEKHNLTIDRALHPIDLALNAEKINEFTGEITPDYSVQLKASDRVLKLLGVTQTETNSVSIHLTDKSTTYNI